MSGFPLGRAIPVLLAAALACTPFILTRHSAPRPAVLLWLPSPTHARLYAPLLADWRTPDGATVGIERIAERGLNVRLATMFMGGRRDDGVPDLVQLEISRVGTFLRPPVPGVGLLPLDAFLDAPRADGPPWRQRLLDSRLAPYRKDGVQFGLPFDLHPTALCYREDLWREAGIDLAAIPTWEGFHDACLEYETYWRAHGHREYAAFATKPMTADHIIALHLQRHADIAGDDGPRLEAPLLRDTVLRYARMVGGARRIGIAEADTSVGLAGQMAAGEVGACLAPDWRVAILRTAAPGLAGRVRLRPLPRFDPQDRPTTTMGGTMIGITRACRDPARAWAVIERLYLSEESQRARATLAFFSPMPSGWPAFAAQPPDPFCGGQRVGELFAGLAPEVPPRNAVPAATMAAQGVANVLNRARVRLDAGGEDGLEAACAGWLAREQAAIHRALANGSFE